MKRTMSKSDRIIDAAVKVIAKNGYQQFLMEQRRARKARATRQVPPEPVAPPADVPALRRLRLSRSAVASRWARPVAGVGACASGSGRLVGRSGWGDAAFDSSMDQCDPAPVLSASGHASRDARNTFIPQSKQKWLGGFPRAPRLAIGPLPQKRPP